MNYQQSPSKNHTLIEAKLLTALQALGASDINHSNRTLLDHLNGTYQLLKSWDSPEYVCIAGLFHSIYGTEFFKTETLSTSDREVIKQLIGNRSEQLAYYFCAAKRNQLFRQTLKPSSKRLQLAYYFRKAKRKLLLRQSITPSPKLLEDRYKNCTLEISDEDFKNLFEIEIANIIEQIPDRDKLSKKQRSWHIKYLSGSENIVSDAAFSAYKQYFIDDGKIILGI